MSAPASLLTRPWLTYRCPWVANLATIALGVLMTALCADAAPAQDFDDLLAEYEAARKAYERDLEAWKQDQAAHQSEVATFQRDAENYGNLLAAFNVEADQYESQVAAYAADLQEHDRALSQHHSDVQSHNAAVQTWQSEAESFEVNVEQWKRDNEDLETKAAAYKADVEEHNAYAAKVDGAVDAYNAELAQYEGAVAYYNSLPPEQRTEIQYNRLVHWKRNLDIRRAAVERELAKVNASKQSLDGRKEKLESESQRLLNQLQRLQSVEADLQQRRAGINARKQQLDAQAAAIDSRAADLAQRKSSLDQQRSSLESRAADLERQRMALAGRESELQRRKEMLDRRKAELDQRLKELHQMLDRLEELLRNPQGAAPRGRLLNPASAALPLAAQLPTAAAVARSPRELPPGLSPFGDAGPHQSAPTGVGPNSVMAGFPPLNLNFKENAQPASAEGRQPILRPRPRTLTGAEPKGIPQPARAAAGLEAPTGIVAGNGTDDLDERERRLQRLRELDRQIKEYEEKKQQARRRLEAIVERVPQITAALEDWARLVDEARDDVFWQAVSTGLSVFLSDKSIQLRDAALIKRQDLDALQWRRFRPDADPDLSKKIAELLREIHLIEGRAQLVQFFDHSLAFAEITKGMMEDKKSEAAIEVAKLFIQDPRAKLLLEELEFVAAVGYAHVAGRVARSEIERLNELTEAQLREVEQYGAKLREWTDKINELKAEQRRVLLGG